MHPTGCYVRRSGDHQADGEEGHNKGAAEIQESAAAVPEMSRATRATSSSAPPPTAEHIPQQSAATGLCRTGDTNGPVAGQGSGIGVGGHGIPIVVGAGAGHKSRRRQPAPEFYTR